MSSAGKLHALAAPVKGGIKIKDQTLVVQYEVDAIIVVVLSSQT